MPPDLTHALAADEARLAWHDPAALGEGLHWDPLRQRLWWVDILTHRVLAWGLDPEDPPQAWRLPHRVGWVLPCQGQSALLLGLQPGVAACTLPEPGGSPQAPREVSEAQLQWLLRPLQDPALRLNDAKADITGAVWLGCLNHEDERRADGALWRWHPGDGSLHRWDAGLGVANGPAVDPFGQYLVHNDSAARTLYRFALDIRSGTLGPREVWKVFSPAEGHPDGMNFDAEGGLWVAHWGAGCVSRFAPDGRLLRRVWVPAEQVTNVCLAGPRLDRLFITTARTGLDAQALARQPLAGSLFELPQPGVRGLPGLPAACPAALG
ncbi:SMP-30/gluconolactonase/LRE family protein [Ideonella livida]|uniref:SMP-30/gluconolactonase/LRE family protein n=1 Tax=Ideonella livida TaxID=2707176 RepID=A0A7C9TMD8_9BURK|nr:SMP-30/gluconolactonase/LRE family protein [Ideonella livida]NDY93242.1 SMP-30/gluconolactonase/LRE family protein [Ideonella livida]